MKPSFIVLRLMGFKKIILGSSGFKGKEAGQKLIEYLKVGYSTTITPDGPYGPAKVIKNGIFHMAEQSEVRLWPIKFECSASIRLPTWDRKILPLPFAKIRVIFGDPLSAKGIEWEELKNKLAAQM